jgi:antitoxin (DNA-binding transcriptional repressor) of toxin-antitoxin stability system
MKISVAEARNALPRLIKAVEDGASVTICRHGRPVVDLVRTTKGGPDQPKFGTLEGLVKEQDPDWWKPLTSDELDAWLGGD